MADIIFPCCEHCVTHDKPHAGHLLGCKAPGCPGSSPVDSGVQSVYDQAQSRRRPVGMDTQLADDARFAVTHDDAISMAKYRAHRNSVDTVETNDQFLLELVWP
jgi:hypothetical protein